jgi:hypothetical protein
MGLTTMVVAVGSAIAATNVLVVAAAWRLGRIREERGVHPPT